MSNKDVVTNEYSLLFGDCLERMKEIPNGSVDLTVTSPPYDNLRTYAGTLEWNFDIFKQVTDELYRITKDGGVVVWVVGDATIKGSETGTSFRQALHFKEIGFNLHDTMIWDKEACRFPDTVRYYDCFEYMFILSKGKPKSINQISDKRNKWANTKVHGTLRQRDGTTKETLGKGKRLIKEFGVRFNLWKIHNTGKAGNKHPAIFPEQLASDHIISWSNENDLVFDPFMGSGTTGKMAKLNNRKFIGIEKVPEYFEIAQERINAN